MDQLLPFMKQLGKKIVKEKYFGAPTKKTTPPKRTFSGLKSSNPNLEFSEFNLDTLLDNPPDGFYDHTDYTDRYELPTLDKPRERTHMVWAYMLPEFVANFTLIPDINVTLRPVQQGDLGNY
jgi:hypothetical protein